MPGSKGVPVRTNDLGDATTNGIRRMPELEKMVTNLVTDYYYELRRRAAGIESPDHPGGDTRVATVKPGEEPVLSPIHKFLKTLGGDFKTIQQVSDEVSIQIGVKKSPGAIRNLSLRKRVNAPSRKVKFGKGIVYLYTPEDVEEIINHYKTAIVIEDA